MSNLEPGSFECGGLYFSLSAEVLAKRRPYAGPQRPTTGTVPAALATPAPSPVRISPAPTPAPTSLSADGVDGADQPDVCSLSFQQQNLWRKPSGEPWQSTGNASKPARPGLSLRALEELRR